MINISVLIKFTPGPYEYAQAVALQALILCWNASVVKIQWDSGGQAED